MVMYCIYIMFGSNKEHSSSSSSASSETMQGVELKSKNRVAQDELVRCDTLRRWFVHAIHSVSTLGSD